MSVLHRNPAMLSFGGRVGTALPGGLQSFGSRFLGPLIVSRAVGLGEEH
jgi:hypothetical protein